MISGSDNSLNRGNISKIAAFHADSPVLPSATVCLFINNAIPLLLHFAYYSANPVHREKPWQVLTVIKETPSS